VGNRLVTPLNQTGRLHTVPWLRDVFPDMLWLGYHLTGDSTAGMYRVAHVLDVIMGARDGGDASDILTFLEHFLEIGHPIQKPRRQLGSKRALAQIAFMFPHGPEPVK
jgi:hypothetical protein